MISHTLYSFHHMHYIWHLIYSVLCHIHYMCYITQWPCLWHQTLYVSVIFIWYGIRHSDVTTKPLCAFQTLCLTLHSMYFLHYTQYTNFLKRSECMSSQSLYMTPYALHVTSHPHFMTPHHFTYDVKSSISNNTSILSDLTSTVYV